MDKNKYAAVIARFIDMDALRLMEGRIALEEYELGNEALWQLAEDKGVADLVSDILTEAAMRDLEASSGV